MTITEYNKIKDLNYEEVIQYLNNKYGPVKGSYFNFDSDNNWIYHKFNDKVFLSKNTTIRRLADGLIIHHNLEDMLYDLSNKYKADLYPKEYQYGSNLVYCDLLEHFLLHILICEKNPQRKMPKHLLWDVLWCVTGKYPEAELHNSPATYQQDLECYKKCVIGNMDVLKVLLQKFKKIIAK